MNTQEESSGSDRSERPTISFTGNIQTLAVGDNTTFSISQCDQSQEPPRISPNTSSTLESILNRRIIEENKKILRFGKDLATPRDEKMPKLRRWAPHRAQTRTLDRESSFEGIKAEPDGQEVSGQEVCAQEIFLDSRFTAIVGGPGSGKSTYVRRYGRMILNQKIEQLREVKIVYFINVCELAMDLEETDFSTFFFSKLVHGFDSIQGEALLWLKDEENQKRVLIIMDGLNDFRGFNMDNPHEFINYEDRATPETILFNLLQGRLLPKAKILAATRWHGIQKYEQRIQPQQSLKLVGFTENDSKYLFKEMTSSTNTDLWEKLSERLKSLCRTPLWLVYVAYMMKQDPNHQMDNISSIIISLLQNFRCKEKWDLHPDIFTKLKRFCLDKMRQLKGIFTEKEVEDFGLKKDQILSLCITVPKADNAVFEQDRHGSYVYFSHTLIQESLSCLGFLDLGLEEFRKVLDETLEQPAFRTFMQMACGILLNQHTRSLCDGLISELSHDGKKKELLVDTLRINSDGLIAPEHTLQHLKCVQETGLHEGLSEILPHSVNLDMRVLSLADTHSISTAIASCGSLEELSLHGCGIDDEKLKVLSESLAKSCSTISLLNLGGNLNISKNGIAHIADIIMLCNVRHLDLHLCELKAHHMNVLYAKLREKSGVRIKSLKLRSNFEIGHEGMQAVAGIIEVVKLEELDVSNCKMSSLILGSMMAKNLNSLRVLKLAGYMQERDDRMRAVGKCVIENEINELHINWSSLQSEDLKCLASMLKAATKAVRITFLNISNNKDINTRECVNEVCCIAKLAGTEMMDIHGCEFSEAQKNEIRRYAKFCRMDNYKTVKCNSSELTGLLERNKGRFIDVSLSGTSKTALSKLPRLLDKYRTRFGRLCLPEGKSATEEDVEIIAMLIPYVAEELWLGNWEIGPEGRKRLADARLQQLSYFPNMDIFYAGDDSSRNPKLPSRRLR